MKRLSLASSRLDVGPGAGMPPIADRASRRTQGHRRAARSSRLLNELGPQFEQAPAATSSSFTSTPRPTSSSRINIGHAVRPRRRADRRFQGRRREGPFRRDRRSNIARVGYGVAVRAGAPKPDIRTPDAFKKTLLDARRSRSCRQARPAPMSSRCSSAWALTKQMKAKTKAQAGPTADRAGRRQRRSRARRVPHQRVDRARRRTRRPLPRRFAAGAGIPGGRRDRQPRKRTPPRPSSIFSRRRPPLPSIKAAGMNPG